MDMIKYEFGAIEGAAADIRNTAARMNNELDNLKSSLQPMVASWEGESAAAYQAAQAKWDQAAAELNAILDSISGTVNQGNQRMSEINRQAAGSWG